MGLETKGPEGTREDREIALAGRGPKAPGKGSQHQLSPHRPQQHLRELVRGRLREAVTGSLGPDQRARWL